MSEPLDLEMATAYADRWWSELWAEGRIDLVDELVAPRHVRHSSSGSRWLDREEFKIELVQHQRVLHRPVTEINALTVTDGIIWSRATSRGANLDTGEPMVVCWLQMQRLEQAMLAESWLLTATGTDWVV